MPKQKIAILSTLKPVDDIRSFHKIAKSIVHHFDVEVHLFGYPGNQPQTEHARLHFHATSAYRRLGIIRIFVGIKLWMKLIKLKPELIIVNTFELLTVTSLCKIIFGSKILYDIQENYNFNILYQGIYPRLLRGIIAQLVRFKEKLTAPLFDHFILAEECYKDELNFIGKRFTILENKAITPNPPSPWTKKKEAVKVLFSGTITRSNGIERATEIMQRIHHQYPSIKHSIIGHCSDPWTQGFIQQRSYSFIDLKISESPVPYAEIAHEIDQSTIGLVTYQINKSNQNCLPTKVFDYVSRGLPIVFERGTNWEEFILKQGIGLGIDFTADLKDEDIESMLRLQRASTHVTPPSALWTSEEPKLIRLMKELLAN